MEKQDMPAIAHEAEIQRQHPRFRLPMKCLHQNISVPVIDLSVGGIGVKSEAFSFRLGKVVDLTLIFPFTDYELSLPVRAEVRYTNHEHGRSGLRFIDVSPRQRNLLRFVLDAYLSGEVVEFGDVLDVVSRKNEGPARDIPQHQKQQGFLANLGHHSRRIAGYGILAGITIFLAVFVGAGVFQRMYVISAQSALITTDLVTVPAPSSGQLTFVAAGNEIHTGEPLLTIQGPQGSSSIVIDSPCDCVIQARYSRVSSFVREGVAILALREKMSRPYITASISQSEIMRFYRGARAIVEYADGTLVHDVRIEPLPMLFDTDASAGRFLVKLSPGRELDETAIGQPVSVAFNTFPSSLFGIATGKLQSSMIRASEHVASLFRAKASRVPDDERVATLK